MSNTIESTTDPVQELLEEAEKTVQIAEKEKFIRNDRTEKAYDQLIQDREDRVKISSVDILKVNEAHIEKMDRDHDLTVLSMKDRLPFVNEILTELVPYNFPNLLFLGAKSGNGKTSFTSAAVLSLLRAGKKVLVISNEELASNYYNRVICLNNGWDINRLKDFTPEEHEKLKRMRTNMYRTGRLNVIDGDFDGMKGATSTMEGIVTILEKVYDAQVEAGGTCPYDSIWVDFYQNCGTSIANRKLRTHEVLERLSKFFDNIYKRLHAPLTILGQIKPESKDEDSFEFRIKDSKSIYIPCTFALELQPDKARQSTKFIVHKHRWSNRNTEAVELGFDKGRFIPYTMEFQEKIATAEHNREHAKLMDPILSKMKEKK